jgi:uncharacterized protein YjbI with pentapeptide repeats
MRASNFKRCTFVGAVLRGADLRRSSFEDCDFTAADVSGAVVEDEGVDGRLHDFLSPEQWAAMALSADDGPESPGG